MCLISYEKNFLFIHVPKTGGKSLGNVLVSVSEDPRTYLVNRLLEMIKIRVNHYGPYRSKRFRGHSTAATIRKHFPRDVYNSLFKFAIVRNPWDALVSQYHFVLESTNNKRHKQVKGKSFEEFIYWYLNKPNKGRQKQFVADAQGNCIVDFVGRFESLAEDTNYILDILGMEGQLSHIGPSKHRDYRTYYSDQLAEFVGDQLADDAQFFGYNFDGIIHTPSYMQKVVKSQKVAA
ncbi:MAG: sulfotransferase [Blastopirellula sp.]|nr:MAG: sulfotransferase [Blastopirellula sp.]